MVVADDDAELRAILAHALRAAGHHVVLCESGAALLDFLATSMLADRRSEVPAVILLDVRMPGWDGLEILRGLRQAHWTIPVVLMTAVEDASVALDAERFGATAFLRKPIDLATMLAVVERTTAIPHGAPWGQHERAKYHDLQEPLGSRDARGRAPRAFVAERDPETRALVRHALVHDGWSVVEASDGADMLDLLGDALDSPSNRPDVVVLGASLPGYSGLGILLAMRNAGQLPPTIVLAGPDDAAVEGRAEELGAVGVLHRPLDVDDFRMAVVNAARLRSTTA